MFAVDGDEITPETDLRQDLEADSLDLFELMTVLEEEYEISDREREELRGLNKAGEIARYIQEHLE